MRNSPPTFKGFLSAFGANWFTKMSGPLTVPFTLAALFVPATLLKALFAALAILCGGTASYAIWAEERKKLCVADQEIERLTELPDIRGEILAVFWEFGDTNYGMEIGKNSRYYVRLRLVNHNDVPCTINEYRILAADLDGQRSGHGIGIPSEIGKLRHPGSGYRDEATERVWDDKFREDRWTWTKPINIASQWPLERARKQEGWVTFDVYRYIPSPIKEEDAPSEYLCVAPWQQRITIRVTDSLGGTHDIPSLYVDVAPVRFAQN